MSCSGRMVVRHLSTLPMLFQQEPASRRTSSFTRGLSEQTTFHQDLTTSESSSSGFGRPSITIKVNKRTFENGAESLLKSVSERLDDFIYFSNTDK